MNIVGLLRKAVSHLPEDFRGLFKIWYKEGEP